MIIKIRKTRIVLTSAVLAALLSTSSLTAQSVHIAANVEDVPITETDVDYRVLYILLSSGIKPTEEAKRGLRKRVLDKMIDEQLQLLEGAKIGITMKPETLQDAIHSIEQREGLQPGNLKKMAKEHGIPEYVVEEQIAAGFVWREVVMQRFRDILISDSEVDAYVKKLELRANQPSYPVAEIFFPVDSQDQEPRIYAEAQKTVAQLRGGANFPELARLLSRSASARQGGLIGNVSKGMLEAPLEAALEKLADDGISDPVRGQSGYYILKKLPSDEQSFTLLKVAFPVSNEEQVQQAAMAIMRIRKQHMSCSQRQKEIESAFKGVRSTITKDVSPKRLDPQLLKLLRSQKREELSPPINGGAEILSIALCSIDENKPQAPTREAAKSMITEQKMVMNANRLLRDLKRNAHIAVFAKYED